MAGINTHGIKINLESLAAASEDTVECANGCRNLIFFDMENGEVWVRFAMPGEDIYYRDDAVVPIAGTSQHHTQQWIADRIADRVHWEIQCHKDIGWDFPWDILDGKRGDKNG